MCAIAGIFDKSGELGPARIAQVAKQAADQMSYRGPDDCGLWSSPDGRCAFAHRRLAILDTSFAGHQPMVAVDRLSVIVFNGEIYNFIELRGELQTKGEVFRSRSDTEVLLSLLNRERDDALPRLDGMFAFAYYDVRSRELILARDMFGEKPLFYVDTDKYFAFASELHALTHLPGFDVGINRETIASYLSQQYVPAPNTIYSAARKLQPGSYLKFRLGTKTE